MIDKLTRVRILAETFEEMKQELHKDGDDCHYTRGMAAGFGIVVAQLEEILKE